MLNDQLIPSTTIHATDQQDDQEEEDEQNIREIHALTPPRRPPPSIHSHRPSSLSMASTSSSENFTSMSREFNALVLAGSSIDHYHNNNNNNNNHNTTTPTMIMNNHHDINNEGGGNNNNNNLGRIGEEELMEETNPLAIVPDHSLPLVVPSIRSGVGVGDASSSHGVEEISVEKVKKEEIGAKILAWQNAKIAKINNRFKREDAVISGWESEKVQKATSWMKKVERKLEEKRARALEKMQNEVAKSRRKAEERRASAEAKRGTKVARVLEIAGLMRAVGRPPSKKSFF